MEIDKFVANFASQFEETDVNEFSSTKKFRELEEWNSLIALQIIAMVDDEYGVKITGEDIRKSQAIEDIYNIVKLRI
jgi:acyl carrier protein